MGKNEEYTVCITYLCVPQHINKNEVTLMEKSYFEISQNAIAHLRNVDPKFGRYIELVGNLKREIISDPFTALVQSIVYQQLAYAAANTIWRRFLSVVESLTPISVYDMQDTVLRGCGLSGVKVQYIKNIAKAFLDKKLTNEKIFALGDEELVQELVKIKGVGIWTAQMFLIFCLHRQDVFSYKDLGLRRGVQWLYGLDEEPTEVLCNELKKKWHPYSSAASLYLWEITIQNHFKTTSNELLYNYLKNEPTVTSYYDSPVGTLKIVTSSNGLEKLEFTDDKCKVSDFGTPLSNAVKTQLTEYFAGNRCTFDLPLYFSGTMFQKTVWHALCTLCCGQTKNYGQVAHIIGNDKASRAVGGANNKNKIAIVVPCHRVIGTGGSLTGYAGGLDKKQWLLAHEAQV